MEGDGPEPRRFKRDGTNGGVMPPTGEDGEPDGSEEQGGDHDGAGGAADTGPESENDGETAGEPGGTSGSPERGPVEDVGTGKNEDPLAVGEEVRPDGPKGGSGRYDDGGGTSGPVGWVLGSDHAAATFLREFVGSALVVVVIGLLLFAISGVWPPMVAVESGSMEPRMERGDLVFVMDQDRFKPGASVMDTGIATYHSSQEAGYEKFGDYGDVIIYRQDGSQRETPIIHRARFWVNESENWYDKANESFVNGDDCASTTNCPAPHSGFITKGDNNDQYDQVSGISGPVKPEWIKGTAELRIPWLGHVRLELSELSVSPSTRRVSPLPRATPGSLVSGAG
jgi:signal peptidase